MVSLALGRTETPTTTTMCGDRRRLRRPRRALQIDSNGFQDAYGYPQGCAHAASESGRRQQRYVVMQSVRV